MFKENPNKGQATLVDPYHTLPKRLKDMLINGWPGYFYRYVFQRIEEKKFAVLFSEKLSRPNSPVNIIIGLLFLKELNNWTDIETIGALYFDYRVQYALGITDIAEEGICLNTLGNMRCRLYNYLEETGIDILKEENQKLTKELIEIMEIDLSMARQDSMMISSNCKAMGRLELIYTVNLNMVKALFKYSDVPEELKHYLDKEDKVNSVYRIKKEEAESKIEQLLKETEELLNMVPQELYESIEYKNLSRLLNEQTDENGPLKNQEIPADSLQNPSEPDATYRNKNGKKNIGYVLNVVEVRDQDKKAGMIIHHDLETNVTSDVELGEKALSSELEGVKSISSDGAYYNTDNMEKAEERGIKLTYSDMTGRDIGEGKLGVDQFNIDPETKKIIECPGGKLPEKTDFEPEKEKYKAKFNKEDCLTCPLRESCPVVEQVKYYSIQFDEKRLKAANQRNLLSTEENKLYAKFRAGVEGVPSVLRRRYGIDRVPVRGLNRSRLLTNCKIMMYNFRSFLAYSLAGTEKSIILPLFSSILSVFLQKMHLKNASGRKETFVFQLCA